jgi:hypothetical protein
MPRPPSVAVLLRGVEKGGELHPEGGTYRQLQGPGQGGLFLTAAPNTSPSVTP